MAVVRLVLAGALRTILRILRLDGGACVSPLFVGPFTHGVEVAARAEVARAIHVDQLAAQPVAAVRHEEGGEVLQLAHLAAAPLRIDARGSRARRLARIEPLAHPLGGDLARADGIEAYAVARPLQRQRTGHGGHARLAHRRGADERSAALDPGADDRDDRPRRAAGLPAARVLGRRDPALADGIGDV